MFKTYIQNETHFREIIMDMDINIPNDVPVREKNRIRNILTSSTK